MNGLICLQGGGEFEDPCNDVDHAWLDRVDAGIVAIAPLAAAAGREYRSAANHGAEYLRALGVHDIIVAPEPESSRRGAVRAIIDADTVVIPGGSPVRIWRRVVDTAIGGALRAHLVSGGTLVGASAGAMVLGEVMLLPGDDMQVRAALNVVPGVLALPHYGEPRSDIVDQVADQLTDDVSIVGIPACCGVIYGAGDPFSAGPEDCWEFPPKSEPATIPRG